MWSSRVAPLRFSPSRTSHAVERMEGKGWIIRELSPDDRRVKLVKLTPGGTEIFREVWPHHAHLVRDLFLAQMTSEERTTLATVFARVSEASRARPRDTDKR